MNNGIMKRCIGKPTPLHATCLVILLLILLIGCNISDSQQDQGNPFPNFTQIIDVEDLPEGIEISPSNPDTVIDLNHPVEILITNDSDHTIAFPPGYGTRLFGYGGVEKQWIEINNRVNYIGEGDTLGSKSQGSDNWAAIVTVAPEIAEDHSYKLFRVVVIGSVIDSTGLETSRVAAYIDLPIE